MIETFYEVMRRQGISRRSFLKFCSLTAGALGLSPSFAPRIAHAMETSRAYLSYGCMVWSAPAVLNHFCARPIHWPRM